MRYHWGLGVGHTYSHGRATASGSENPGTGIAENEADDNATDSDPVNDAIEGPEAEDQDGDYEGSDSGSESNLEPSAVASAKVWNDLDSDDEEIYDTYEDSDV